MPKKRSTGFSTTEHKPEDRDLPSGQPYKALGMSVNGASYYVVDGLGLFRTMPSDIAGHPRMLGLVGPDHQDWLFYNYPRWRVVDGELVRVARAFQPEQFFQDVLLQCQRKGVFDPMERVRQQGAWLGEDGDLIFNCGKVLWTRGGDIEFGLRNGYAYTRGHPIPEPWREKVGPEVGREVLEDFSRWQFGRYTDPQLILGLLGVSFLAGAMAHRPHVFLVGEHASGKSGILEQANHYLGERALYSSDATPAGLTQTVGYRNMALLLDEREARDDPKHDINILAMMRGSYGGGGVGLRGSADHRAVSFLMRCCIWAAAINPPVLESADRSRIVVITVKAPPDRRVKATPQTIRLVHDARRERMGTMLLRRLADQWKRLQLEVLPAWREYLAEVGYDGRGCDTMATLLAVAWVMREDKPVSQGDVDLIAPELHAMEREERAERLPSYDRFLAHVLGLSVDPMRRGEWRTVIEMLKQAGGYGTTPESECRVESEAIRVAASDDGAIDAARQLSRLGIKIGKDEETGDRLLLIANQSTALADMLKGTMWAGLPGRTSPWQRMLERAPGAVQTEMGVRFASGLSRATKLSLGWVLRGAVGPQPEEEQVRWEKWAAARREEAS